MQSFARRKHTAVLKQYLTLADARVIDIGCGDGSLVRYMARKGAHVVGIECSHLQLAAAKSAERVGGEGYVFAVGQALPFSPDFCDIAIFFNSLHHIPVAEQPRALGEAARVLRPGGLIHIVEPIAEGPYFELVRSVEDETVVRAKAYHAIGEATERGLLTPVLEYSYLAPVTYDSFEAFYDRLLAVDESRGPALQAQRDDLKEKFLSTAEEQDGRYSFFSPFRLNLLRSPH